MLKLSLPGACLQDVGWDNTSLSFPYVVVGEAIFIILGGDLSRELQCDR